MLPQVLEKKRCFLRWKVNSSFIKNASDTPVKVGDVVKEGDVLCYVEAMKTYNAVRAEFGGTITAICLSSGDAVSEDDVLMTIQ